VRISFQQTVFNVDSRKEHAQNKIKSVETDSLTETIEIAVYLMAQLPLLHRSRFSVLYELCMPQ
jgi:hypothetical protein